MAESVEIWPDHDEISTDLIEISSDLVKSGLDLDEISPNIVGSDGISSNLRRRTPNTTGFCKFSSKILRISSEVFGFIIRSGGLRFGEETRQPTRRVSGPMGSDPQLTSEWSIRMVFGSGLGGLLGLVGSPGWVDSPN